HLTLLGHEPSVKDKTAAGHTQSLLQGEYVLTKAQHATKIHAGLYQKFSTNVVPSPRYRNIRTIDVRSHK
ncbi:MAG: hypothetical protein ACYSW7_08400, partial [Planctomycetota bacterium]